MLDGIYNLIEMSLCLNKSSPIFRTIREIPGIALSSRSRHEQQLNDGPSYYVIVRRKLQQVFVFRIIFAVNLSIHSLT